MRAHRWRRLALLRWSYKTGRPKGDPPARRTAVRGGPRLREEAVRPQRTTKEKNRQGDPLLATFNL